MTAISRNRYRGFSLIEVMIAVVVLSFGLLALAALQAGLFRAGAETKARANATAIAQQVIEDAKTFAYSQPPVGAYTSSTYQSLDTGALAAITIGGVNYAGCRQVVRYRYDKASNKFIAANTVNFASTVAAGVPTVTCANVTGTASGAVDASIPEFKQVKVAVAWVGDGGQLKSVEISDSVSSVSPSDSIQVVKTPNNSGSGPQVYIVPPNKGNPGVVPIAIGTGDEQKAAASSNPKPQQFADDVSSVTTFSVQTFTGDSTGEEVLLNRKIDVAAVSCVCSDDGTSKSTATSPAYRPTIWNGKQLAYTEPPMAPVGTGVGVAVVSNSDKNVQSLCTVCCRDHRDAVDQSPKVDPYRASHDHFGYKKNGNSYLIGDGLFALGPDTDNQYVEACRLVRVGGQMRLAVDARQNNLLVTPLNSGNTAFQQTDFVSRYSNFVSDYIKGAANNLPTGYPSAGAALPGPTSTELTAYSDITSPGAIALADADERKLVAFGLYVDYLSDDTLFAFNCARTNDNTGDCEGYGGRNPLEYIPFYAVNVANLGAWESQTPNVASVAGATFDNKGLLKTDGGIVTAGAASSVSPVPVSESINISNSGLTATVAVDPDDAATSSQASDAQDFTKTTGSGSTNSDVLWVKADATSLLKLSAISVMAGGAVCNYQNSAQADACNFTGPTTLSVRIANFTTSDKKGVITNRKVCLPTDSLISSVVAEKDNTIDEAITFSVGILQPQDYTLTIKIVDESTTCSGGSINTK